MTIRNKGNTTPPQTKAKLLASRRIAILTNAYVYSESARQDVAKAIFAKRPRSYGEINSPMNKYSYLFSYFAHFCSILLALPFIAYSLGFFVKLIGYPTPPIVLMYSIAAVILFIFEVGQSKTLNQTFDNFYNDGNYPIEAAIVAAGFSIFSIVSSTYSGYHFLQDHSEFIVLVVSWSLLMETLIIYCNFFRHRYQYHSRLEAEMLNDFSHNTNSNALFEPFKKTSAKSQPINYNQVSNQAPKVEIDSGAKNGGTQILKPSKMELEKYGIFKQQTNPLQATKTAKVSTKKEKLTNKQTPSLTVSTPKNEEKWMLYQVRNFESSYKRKIADEGKTFSKVANKTFFSHYLKNWKTVSTDGEAPKVSAVDRKKWYEENYPEVAVKLKAMDKKKRKK